MHYSIPLVNNNWQYRMLSHLQALLKLGSPDGAAGLFREMRSAGLAPGLAAYTTLIVALGRARDRPLADAFAAMADARACGYTPDVVVRGNCHDAALRQCDLHPY
jgi:pentatricopeptide repeat protein